VASVLNRKLLREVWQRRGQILAIAFIIAGGVSMLVMSLGVLSSLEASRDRYYETNGFPDVFASAVRAPESLRQEIAAISGVTFVETRIARDVTLDLAGLTEPAAGRLVSLPTGPAILNRVTLTAGRFPEPGESDEVVINEAFAEANELSPGDHLAAVINGLRRSLTVAGIGLSPEFTYTLPPGGFMPDNRRFGVLWMNRDALEAAFDLGGAFNDLGIALARNASADTVIDALDVLLDPFGGTGAYERRDQQSHAYLSGEIDQLWNMVRILPVIFMTVAAYLLNTILARMIDAEREQIGVLKAFGYTNLDVAAYYLKLALIVAAIGLLLGYALGAYLEGMMSATYMRFYSFPTFERQPSLVAVVAGALVALGSAAVGALSGMRRALRLAPATAISPEPPPVYGKGPLAHFDGSGLFDGPTRMIFRHLVRWPARSGSTILGVATATGLLIATFFSHDATSFIMEFTFEKTGGYHAALTFVSPRSISALAEVARLPGVIEAEPGRDVAVRVRNGVIEETALMVGMETDARLRRLVDPEYRALPVPPDGIVLSSQLASMLEVSRGEPVAVEMLETGRTVEAIHVSAISEDLVGAQGYVSRELANRLLLEGDAIQSAYVTLDPLAEASFYEAVKERPQIGTVTMQRAALQMFKQTVAESQNIMMRIFQALSAAIAAGVVYTASRITLSERARELASMRVLGFRRLEVSYILLGQLLLLVLLALPLGCLFGYGISVLIATGLQTELYRVPVVILPQSYGTAVLIVLAAAVATSIIARRQIDRLDLIEVLKTRD
jgi:putative ABC transport system permease protein